MKARVKNFPRSMRINVFAKFGFSRLFKELASDWIIFLQNTLPFRFFSIRLDNKFLLRPLCFSSEGRAIIETKAKLFDSPFYFTTPVMMTSMPCLESLNPIFTKENFLSCLKPKKNSGSHKNKTE